MAFALDDGWVLSERKLEESKEYYRFVVAHPTPRPNTVWDQVKTDLKAPKAVLLWTVALALLIYGIAQKDLGFVFPGITIVAVFGPSFVNLVRLKKHGQLVIVRSNRIIRSFGDFVIMRGVYKLKGETKKIEVTLVNSDQIQALLKEHTFIEIRTLIDMGKVHCDLQKNNSGIAFRAPKGQASEPISTLPKAIVTSESATSV